MITQKDSDWQIDWVDKNNDWNQGQGWPKTEQLNAPRLKGAILVQHRLISVPNNPAQRLVLGAWGCLSMWAASRICFGFIFVSLVFVC